MPATGTSRPPGRCPGHRRSARSHQAWSACAATAPRARGTRVHHHRRRVGRDGCDALGDSQARRYARMPPLESARGVDTLAIDPVVGRQMHDQLAHELDVVDIGGDGVAATAATVPARRPSAPAVPSGYATATRAASAFCVRPDVASNCTPLPPPPCSAITNGTVRTAVVEVGGRLSVNDARKPRLRIVWSNRSTRGRNAAQPAAAAGKLRLLRRRGDGERGDGDEAPPRWRTGSLRHDVSSLVVKRSLRPLGVRRRPAWITGPPLGDLLQRFNRCPGRSVA